jgi:hypothetical protein
MNEHVALPALTPGIYLDMTAADYHADCCPAPSLSQSIAKVLLDRSPKHAWTRHPRLNPHYRADDDTKYDIGNIAHRILLGRGKDLRPVIADDWRTKSAREQREAAAAEGMLGVLEKDLVRAGEMAVAAGRQISEAGFGADWKDRSGDGEVVISWRENDIWFRAMIDWLGKDRRRVWDYKTSSASAAPYRLGMKMADDGWDVQAAMHERGLDVLDPKNAGRREHLFVCQENEPPYALTIARLPESALHIGRRKLSIAIATWSDCIRTGQWPGYPPGVCVPEYPGFAEAKWLDREVSEFAERMNRPAPALQDLSGAC